MWSEQKGMKLVLLNSMKESGGHAKDIKFKIRKEYFSDTHLSVSVCGLLILHSLSLKLSKEKPKWPDLFCSQKLFN